MKNIRRQNKLVYGVGVRVNLPAKINGKMVKSYDIWCNMLKRCYCPIFQMKEPSYIGTTVCDEWKTYNKFKEWFDLNYTEGFQLDKDMLVDGNKIYSPSTCCFIPARLNSMFNDIHASQGIHPTGVCFKKRSNKFVARLNKINKREHLGYFDNADDAHSVWLIHKRKYCRDVAIEYYMKGLISENIMNSIILKAYNLK